jgi:hypothetical protein
MPSSKTVLEAFNQNPDDAIENLQALASQYTGGQTDPAASQRGWL